jgi:hypothetical protein
MNEVLSVLDNLKNITSVGYVNSFDLLDSSKHPQMANIIDTIMSKDPKTGVYNPISNSDIILLTD